jgi:hypothetical protein
MMFPTPYFPRIPIKTFIFAGEFQSKNHLQEDVYIFTADQKRPIEDAERRACIVISTYSMLGFTGRRGGDTARLGPVGVLITGGNSFELYHRT